MLRMANGFASGTTGARPELAERLVGALNDGETPRVRLLGSIGQSDLAPNADLAHGRTDADLAQPPAPDAWSPAEVLAHLRGCADVWTQTIIAMLAEAEPAMPVFDPRRWAKAARYADLPYSASLQTFTLQRAELLHVLTPLPLARWQRAARLSNHTHTVYTQARRLALHEKVHCDELEALTI